MHLKTIAFFGFAAALATTAPAFAMGGGGGGHDAHTATVTSLGNGHFSGTVDGVPVQGTFSNGVFSGTFTTSAAEPLSALAVGLGLLGARYLRRRE